MGLTALLDLELAVPDPDELTAFWERRGMRPTGPGVLGTADRPTQLRVRDGAYRHVSEMRLACATGDDLAAIAARVAGLGIAVEIGDGHLRCADPVNDHVVVVEVREAAPLSDTDPEPSNRPGRHDRVGRRAAACLGDIPHAPRRVGHVVFGTTDVAASTAFYVDGLGFAVSDTVGGGLGQFLRCSTDHHNLLLAPSPVPCLNHYALEMDGVDAIGLTGAAVLAERPGCSVAGLGRHVVGANLFWYLLDPSGGMFELYADMDQIVDDEAWERDERRDDWDPFGIAAWMPSEATPDFWLPTDLDEIAAGRAAAGR